MTTQASAETAATKPLTTKPLANRLIWAFFIVAAIGWMASSILSAVHFWVLPLPEHIEPQGSMLVMASKWSYVGPVPLATLGGLYYMAMMAAAGTWLLTKNAFLEKILLPVTALGVAFSAYFVYLQLGPIGAICPFCMVSAAATTLLFTLELIIRRIGGAATAPQVNPLVATPVLIAVPAAMALFAMFSLTILPLPTN